MKRIILAALVALLVSGPALAAGDDAPLTAGDEVTGTAAVVDGDGWKWKWGRDLLLVLIGGIVAVAGGWAAQYHVARTDLRRRQQSVSNGIGSEIAFILMHLNSVEGETLESQAHTLADIDKYVHRYQQMAGDLGLLPPELISQIDGFYGALFRASDEAKKHVRGEALIPQNMLSTLIRANEELGQAILEYHARFDKSPIQEPEQNT